MKQGFKLDGSTNITRSIRLDDDLAQKIDFCTYETSRNFSNMMHFLMQRYIEAREKLSPIDVNERSLRFDLDGMYIVFPHAKKE